VVGHALVLEDWSAAQNNTFFGTGFRQNALVSHRRT
jgi:hypothetical protein